MAFVLRLAGSADSDTVEAARTAHLVREGVRRLLPPVLERAGLAQHAAACRAAPVSGAGGDGGAPRRMVGRLALRGRRPPGAPGCAAPARRPRPAPPFSPVRSMPGRLPTRPRAAALFWPGAWAEAVAILDEALCLGRQAPLLAPAEAGMRLDAAKAARREPATAS